MVRATTGATAAAEPPASAMGHRGSHMCTCCATGVSLQKPSFPDTNLCSGLTQPNQEAFPLVRLLSERGGNSLLALTQSYLTFNFLPSVDPSVLGEAVGVEQQSCLARDDELCHPLGTGHVCLGVSLIANMELLNRPWSSPHSKNIP